MKTIVALLFCASVALAQCPMHEDHSKEHQAGVDARGDQAMGFDHTKTAHHFLIKDDGGVIQVTANDPKDTASRDQIRTHLSHIATMFSDGNFDIPMLIHDRVPPGVPVMKQQKQNITYRYEEMDLGGRVVLSSQNADAVAAIHEFLRFQIEDHRTGDPE